MNEDTDIYKVVSLSGAKIEKALNLLAHKGWRVIYSNFDSMGTTPFVWHILLERQSEK